jgi:hypothetical protein
MPLGLIMPLRTRAYIKDEEMFYSQPRVLCPQARPICTENSRLGQPHYLQVHYVGAVLVVIVRPVWGGRDPPLNFETPQRSVFRIGVTRARARPVSWCSEVHTVPGSAFVQVLAGSNTTRCKGFQLTWVRLLL